MPVNLNDPKQAVVLDKAKVMKIVIELNPRMGGPYVDFYAVLGREVDGAFVEHVDPETSAEALYFRVAPGQNPTARQSFAGGDQSGPGPALGRCAICGAWHTRVDGECKEEGCSGTVVPYDGFDRLTADFYSMIKAGVYGFLTTERVPDPATGEVKPLLAGTE